MTRHIIVKLYDGTRWVIPEARADQFQRMEDDLRDYEEFGVGPIPENIDEVHWAIPFDLLQQGEKE